MLSSRSVNVFGFISIGIMIIMLLLIWRQAVPPSMYVPFFLVAVGLFIIRIVLRIMVSRAERRGEGEEN